MNPKIREALLSAEAALWDGHYSGKGITLEYTRSVAAKIKEALAALDDKGPICNKDHSFSQYIIAWRNADWVTLKCSACGWSREIRAPQEWRELPPPPKDKSDD